MNKIFIIASGAYVSGELFSEYGRISPSAIPLGHETLLFHQIKLLKNEFLYLILPDKEILDSRSEYILKEFDYKIFKSKENESLTNVLYRLLSGLEFDQLKLLLGDTLFSSSKIPENSLTINRSDSIYDWSNARILSSYDEKYIHQNWIISGLFSFNDSSILKQSLSCSEDFESFLVKYDEKNQFEIVVGKNWFDFHHLEEYHRAKTSTLETRKINSTERSGSHLVKTSLDKTKIHNEYLWFKSIPDSLIQFIPAVWSDNNGKESYNIEYIPSPTLQEKFVFGKHSVDYKISLLDSILHLLQKCNDEMTYKTFELEKFREYRKYLYSVKTINRLDDFKNSTNLDLDLNFKLNDIKATSFNSFFKSLIHELDEVIEKCTVNELGFMHGDFCLSNMIHIKNNGLIKMIDPRGNDKKYRNWPDCCGDPLYDLIKLSHSIIGNYDTIICKRFNLIELRDNVIQLEIDSVGCIEMHSKIYEYAKNEFGILDIDLNTLVAGLFVSMLPLHSEDPIRQKVLLLNSLIIFNKGRV